MLSSICCIGNCGYKVRDKQKHVAQMATKVFPTNSIVTLCIITISDFIDMRICMNRVVFCDNSSFNHRPFLA